MLGATAPQPPTNEGPAIVQYLQVLLIIYFRFEWFRTDDWTGAESEAEIRWYVPENMQIGKYRISHSGHRKPFVGFSPRHFTGTTNTFMVVE